MLVMRERSRRGIRNSGYDVSAASLLHHGTLHPWYKVLCCSLSTRRMSFTVQGAGRESFCFSNDSQLKFALRLKWRRLPLALTLNPVYDGKELEMMVAGALTLNFAHVIMKQSRTSLKVNIILNVKYIYTVHTHTQYVLCKHKLILDVINHD